MGDCWGCNPPLRIHLPVLLAVDVRKTQGDAHTNHAVVELSETNAGENGLQDKALVHKAALSR